MRSAMVVVIEQSWARPVLRPVKNYGGREKPRRETRKPNAQRRRGTSLMWASGSFGHGIAGTGRFRCPGADRNVCGLKAVGRGPHIGQVVWRACQRASASSEGGRRPQIGGGGVRQRMGVGGA